MNLRDIDGRMLREAMAIYLEEAHGDARPRRRIPDLTGIRTIEEALPLMEDESRRQEGALHARRWVLRLGNSRYPNMKLVLEEYLLAGEFVFTVDTHDDAVVLTGDPDGPAWRDLRHWNLAVKRRIEARWKKAGLPTYGALRELLRRSRRPRRGGAPRGSILVVDDEVDIADTVEAVLEGEGYRVRKASDGPEALQRVREERPDLILMDYEMPRMKGTEVCARLRKSRRDRDIPVLLATAAMVDLAAIADADGFLVKPYQRDVLLSFVAALVGRGAAAPGTGPAARSGGTPSRASFRRAGGRASLGSRDRSSEE